METTCANRSINFESFEISANTCFIEHESSTVWRIISHPYMDVYDNVLHVQKIGTSLKSK
jgi:hypothetical protein